MSLYLMSTYGEPTNREWFEREWAKAGKKLDAGKACIRFKRPEDLALDVVAEAVRRMPAKKYIQYYKAALAKNKVASKQRSEARQRAKSKGARKSASQRTRAKS
jgi:hypothetical protein